MRPVVFVRPSILIAILLTVSFEQDCGAQTGTGVYSFGAYDSFGLDTVNVGNLNVHTGLPVVNKPGRGMSFNYNLSYDSLIWSPASVNGVTTWSLASEAGWRGVTEIATGYISYVSSTTRQPIRQNPGGPTQFCYNYVYTTFVYHDPFGVAHPFENSVTTNNADACQGSSQSTSSGIATDDSGYTINITNYTNVQVSGKDGHTFNPPKNNASGAGQVQDANGNIVSTTGNGVFYDTLGIAALTVSGSPASSRSFTYADTAGSNQSVIVNYAPYTVQTSFGCSGVAEFGPQSTQLVSSIVYPDGSTYSFTYEPTAGVSGKVTARVNTITLPTGGTIQYTYSGANNGIACGSGTSINLTRSLLNDPAGSTRTYVASNSGATSITTVTDGNGNHRNYGFVWTMVGPYEAHRQVYDGAVSGTPRTDVLTCYNDSGTTPPSNCQTTAPTLPVTAVNIFQTDDGSPQRGEQISFDAYGDPGSDSVFDYGTATARGAVVTSTTYSGYGQSSVYQNYTEKTVVADSYVSDTIYNYDEGSLIATSGLPHHASVSGARGNLTSVYAYLTKKVSSPPVSPVQIAQYTYDDAGQVRTFTDTLNTTSYSYDGTYDAYLTGITSPTVNGVTQSSSFTPDFNTGLNTRVVANGSTWVNYQYDSMLRLHAQQDSEGGSTTWTYCPSGSSCTGLPATISTQTVHAGSSTIDQKTTLDPYGRTQRTSLADDGTSGSVFNLIDYAYDGNGNLKTVSSPYRTGDTAVYTTYAYDSLGRLTAIKQPDCQGATCSTQSASWIANAQTVTDEAGHQRKLVYDGAGRLSQVFEPDVNNGNALTVETDYAYRQNPINGPYTWQTVVTQKGGTTDTSKWRTRSFTYDALGRLVADQTPEAGQNTYVYSTGSSACSGSTGSLCQKTDARGVVTNYAYDAMNRLTGKSFVTTGTTAAVTPAVSFFYDQGAFNGLSIANGIGNRTGMTDGSGSTAWSFDTLGRMKAVRKTLNGTTRQANVTWNADGTPNTLQDFSGSTFGYSYTKAGNPKSVSDTAGNSYAANALYNAAGQLASLTNQLTAGSPAIQRSFGYNVRLQPQTLQASVGGSLLQSLTLGYAPPPGNNGNIASVTNAMDGTHGRDQSYSYDALNRVLTGGDNANWGEGYGYDSWGNLAQVNQTRGSGYSLNVVPDTNNRLPNLGYDLSGDVTQDQFGTPMSYDAEGRMVTAGSASYSYDGDGTRVSKTSSGMTTLYWPVTPGGVADESNSTATSFGRQVFLGGLRVWSEDAAGNGRFLFTDHLGSTRVTTDANGAVKDDLDYRPFGNIVANYGSAPTGNHYTFTGYESDTADSSTDYAQYRNLSLNLGRFHRPDPYMGSYDFSNPQSLNRYSYVMNRPMMLVDPAGLDYIDSNGNLCTQWDDDSGAANVTCMTGLIDLASYFWGGPASGGYVRGNPSDSDPPCKGNNLGILFGGAAEAGAGKGLSLAAQGNVMGGVFYNPNTGQFNAGGNATVGAIGPGEARKGNGAQGWVLGAVAQAGFGLTFGNAGSVQSLKGNATSYSLDVRFLGYGIGGSYSKGDGGIWQFTINPPVAKEGFSLHLSKVQTYTPASLSFGKGCHE